MIYFQLTSLMLFIVLSMFSISLVAVKVKLEVGTKRYKEDLIQGASVTHGMVFKEDGRGVRSVEQPSYAWYERLLN